MDQKIPADSVRWAIIAPVFFSLVSKPPAAVTNGEIPLCRERDVRRVTLANCLGGDYSCVAAARVWKVWIWINCAEKSFYEGLLRPVRCAAEASLVRTNRGVVMLAAIAERLSTVAMRFVG